MSSNSSLSRDRESSKTKCMKLRSRLLEQRKSRTKCNDQWCTSKTTRTKRKACSKTNTRIRQLGKRNWYTNTKLRLSSSKNWKNSSFRSCKKPKRKKERPTRSWRRLCLKPVGAKGRGLAKLEAQPFRNSQALRTEDSQGLPVAKWALLMDSHRGAGVSPTTPWEWRIELAIREQALEVASKMHSLEQILT